MVTALLLAIGVPLAVAVSAGALFFVTDRIEDWMNDDSATNDLAST